MTSVTSENSDDCRSVLLYPMLSNADQPNPLKGYVISRKMFGSWPVSFSSRKD